MGIGRRQFVKLASAALMGMTVDPLQSVITNKDVYVNMKLGILFQKPGPWGFIHVRDFGQLKEEQILGNGWNDLKEEVWEVIGEPICIATKYYEDLPEHKGILSPTITLNVTHETELEDVQFESLEELMRLSEFGTSQLLREFHVTKRYEPYKISGCKFFESDAEYLFEHVELEHPLKVELKVLKAQHGPFYYDFNCHQSTETGQTADKEFEELKRSIKLI